MSSRTQQTEAAASTGFWNRIGAWRSKAFLVAGVLVLGFVASNGLEAFTSMAPPPWINTLFVAPALVAATVGLLGFYPIFVDHVPRMAIACATVVLVAGIAAIVLFGVVTVNAVSTTVELPFIPVYLLTLLTTILGFVLVGLTSLWTGVPSRRVGLLVLGPPTVNTIMLVTAPMNPPQWTAFVISALWCTAILAIGMALRTVAGQFGQTEPAMDSVAN